MPIQNGKYVNPGWLDNGPPAIDATELNAWGDRTEALDARVAGNGLTMTDEEIAIRLSAQQGNVASFGSDGGLFVSQTGGGGDNYTAGDGVSISERVISARLSAQEDNAATFGSDGGIYVGRSGGGGSESGKRYARVVVGTSTAGWTSDDCDVLCDGVSDQFELKDAVDMLPEDGGEIVLLDGTYTVSASFNIDKDNVVLRGNGPSTIIKRSFNTNNYYPDTILGTVGLLGSNCTITSLTVDGNKSVYNGEYNVGIELSGASPTVTNCTVINSQDYCINSETSAIHPVISLCRISGAGDSGIMIVGAGAGRAIISENEVYDCDVGMSLGGYPAATGNVLGDNRVGIAFGITTGTATASGNFIENSSEIGIATTKGPIVISGNVITGSGTANIAIGPSAGSCTITGNILSDTISPGTTPIMFEKSNITQTYAEDCVIVGNIFGGKTVSDPNGSNIIENNK